MAQHPLPVVICSSLAEDGSKSALLALELGAVDIITKPQLGSADFIRESAQHICDAVRAASRARVKRRPQRAAAARQQSLPSPARSTAMLETTDRVIAVGASTGGTEALLTFLRALRPPCPGVLVVQHMPEQFTAQFARRLDRQCAVHVKEAQHGEAVLQSQALIAPGNQHMQLSRSGARYFITLHDGPLVSRHRPSVDVLFRSTAQHAGANAVGVIMTGMGDDGAQGLLAMHQAGAFTLAQDEASCVVFGMPQAAIQLGAVDEVRSLEHLAGAALRRS
jgi:two-component system, chemotaxis family, protein-glutamate methylesterase/glutaminase